MSLLSTFSDTNKVETAALSVRYSSEIASIVNGVTYYKLTRRATKTYQYVGMTKSAAESCVAAKLAQYYRNLASWQFADGKITPRYRFGSGAEIAATPAEGDAWNCAVSVNEDDVIYTSEQADNLAAIQNLFKFAEVRNYDEDNPSVVGVAIITANFDAINLIVSVNYAQNIENFSDANLSLQYYNSSTGAWATYASVTKSTGNVIASGEKRVKYRLAYTSGATTIYSNEVEPIDDKTSTALEINTCVDDVQMRQTRIEYTNRSGYTAAWQSMNVQYYNASGVWEDLGSTRYLYRCENYLGVRMLDGTHHTYRIKYTVNGVTYYSAGFLATGDEGADWPVVISSADAIETPTGWKLKIKFTTPMGTGWINNSDHDMAMVYRYIGSSTVDRYSTSAVRLTNNTYQVEFTGSDITPMEGDKVQLLACALPGGKYAISSATKDLSLSRTSIEIVSATYNSAFTTPETIRFKVNNFDGTVTMAMLSYNQGDGTSWYVPDESQNYKTFHNSVTLTYNADTQVYTLYSADHVHYDGVAYPKWKLVLSDLFVSPEFTWTAE